MDIEQHADVPPGIDIDRAIAASPSRVIWLRHLGEHGATAWEAMPKSDRGRTMSKTTWKPMVDIGWISVDKSSLTGDTDGDFVFSITDAGRKVLSQVAK